MTGTLPAQLAAVVFACLVAGASGARAQASKPSGDVPEWLQRLQTWSRSVTEHVPGRSDLQLVELAAWSADDVRSVVEDYLALRRRLRGRGDGAEFEHKDYRLTAGELRQLAVFDDVAADANAILRRAAMTHADVALLAAFDWSRSTGPPDTLKILDGVVIGSDGQSSHWIVGRLLLDAVEPSPAEDPFVARWYRASAAALLEAREFSAAKPLLEHALDILPRDSNLRYQAGFYHQASAGPSLVPVLRMQQRIVDRTPRRQRVVTTVVETPEWHWKQAEKQFREAVTLAPDHLEARIRLGQALLRLDRPADAAVELRRSAGAVQDGDLGYFVQMLLGQAEERLGRDIVAAACYDRAAALVPEARSPILARAALNRRSGDQGGAWSDLQKRLSPPIPRQIDVDPWWRFYHSQSVPSSSLLAELRASIPAGGAR